MAVRESRKIVLASDDEDDETLKKMTNKAMANVMGSEDLEEVWRRSSRSARTELDGSLTSTHDTVFDQEVLEAVDEGKPRRSLTPDPNAASSASSPAISTPSISVTSKSRITKW